MTPEQLLQTIYLGDRGCKAVLIDSWTKEVQIHVTVISFLKPGATTWDFNTDADIPDGRLVFTNVRRISFEPSGPLPNDFINDITVTNLESDDGPSVYLFELSISSVDDVGNSTEVVIKIEASGLHVEDPKRPGVEIYS